MSRRRPYRRRRGRFGRGEPVPLLLIPDDDRTVGEALVALARLVYRYRSELAPLFTGLAVAGVGWWLHAAHPGWWPWLAAVTALAAVGVLVVPGRWIPGWAVLDRSSERVYAAVVLAAVGGWLSAATTLGPGHRPLPTIVVVGTVVLAVPWWTHHRRRARVRVERVLDGWPVVAEAVGLAGSRVASALVSAWGYTVRLALVGGQTVRDVVDKIPAMESALGTRPGAIRVEPDQSRADRAVLRVVERDPHATPIPWPTTTAAGSIARPVELGLWEDATPVRVLVLRRHVLIGGVMGSGKSGILNVILAVLSGCPDVLLWGVDLKQGMELQPWARCLGRLATTPTDAVVLLRAAVVELNRRAALLAELGLRLWDPSPQSPALVIVIDEYAELSDEAHELADSIARRGRAVAVTLVVATQRPTQQAMGQRAVRSQMDIRICLRVRERKDTDLILGAGMLAAGWHPHTLDAPGKFLLSAPEHTTPRRGRAYHLTDDHIRTTAARNAHTRPPSPPPDEHTQPDDPEHGRSDAGKGRAAPSATGGDDLVWIRLCDAGPGGVTVAELIEATGLSRATVYRRLHAHAAAGRAEQLGDARWRTRRNHPEPT